MVYPKIPKSPLCKNLRRYFKEYCSSSSIHGIRYFGERRTCFERGWWLIVFLMCLSWCAYFINMVYRKWENSPIIVSFATRETPIYEIPFPAVTICPQTKALKSRYSHSKVVSKILRGKKITKKEYQEASYMDFLCDFNITGELRNIYKNDASLNKTFNNYYYTDDEFFDFMFRVSPHLGFGKCRWMNKDYRCRELFKLIITDEGICWTFNMLDYSKIYKELVYYQNIPFDVHDEAPNVTWTLDDGYTDNEGVDTFPRRALFSGAKNGLTIMIEEWNENIDHACKLSLQGFKVTLHSSATMPRPSQQYLRLPLNEVVIAAVQPTMITTSDTVKVFKPEIRQCYFQNEKPLKYFKLYTQRNCQLECVTNFTHDWCGCIGFFMPRENGTYICGSLNQPCLEEAEEILQKSHLNNILGIKYKKRNLNNENENEIPNCDCLPLCTDLTYDIETSASAWDWTNVLPAISPNKTGLRILLDEHQLSMSSLIIYFKNNQFVTLKRHELYGPTDFLANFGGLLGLFTGFSILSLMEIIYFLTVRIVCNIKLYRNWSGNRNYLEKNL